MAIHYSFGLATDVGGPSCTFSTGKTFANPSSTLICCPVRKPDSSVPPRSREPQSTSTYQLLTGRKKHDHVRNICGSGAHQLSKPRTSMEIRSRRLLPHLRLRPCGRNSGERRAR